MKPASRTARRAASSEGKAAQQSKASTVAQHSKASAAEAQKVLTPKLTPPPAVEISEEDRQREAALLQIEDDFYKLLTGGTRVAMLIAMVDTGLAKLLAERGALTAEEILTELRLHRDRGNKWLLLLESVGLLLPERDGLGVKRYRQPAFCQALADPAVPNHFFYRDFLRYWRIAANKDMPSLLRGAKVLDPVRYPPVLWEDVVLLHDWMRDGALATLSSLERRFDFQPYRRILDVAGGDATMATTLARKHPELEVTVFNLPAAATLCRRTIATAGLGERVHVVAGDFRIDSFPTGFDLVMFSRVMADWPVDICRMLMQKAHAALKPGGHLLITEPLRDDNPDLALAWEHSYLPYDDFGAYVYKLKATYQELLTETGFNLLAHHGRKDTIHSLIVAEKI